MPSERTTWRRCASLVGAVMGPERPITWLPTLNRGREGLQTQRLMRVVTDTPVTTRAVAKATRESGGERLSRSPHRPRVTLRRVSRGGSREVRRTDAGLGGPVGRLSGTSVEPTSGGAVGTAWRPTCTRSGSSWDVRSLGDRPRVVKRSRGRDFVVLPLNAPGVARGVYFTCAYRAPRPSISTRGPA